MTNRSAFLVAFVWTFVTGDALAQPVTLAHVRAAVAEQADAVASAKDDIVAVQRDGQAKARWDDPVVLANVDRLGDDLEWTLGVRQTFPLTGTPSAQKLAGDADAKSLEASAQVQQRDLMFTALQLYLDALLEARRGELLAMRLNLMSDATQLVQSRVTAGDASAFELEWIERERRKLDLDVKASQVALRTRLAHLSGLAPLDFSQGVHDEFRATCSSDLDAPLEDEVFRREAAAAQAHQAVVESEWLPAISVEAGWRAAQTSTYESGDQLLQGFVIGLEVALPLWSGNDLRRDAAEARGAAVQTRQAIFQRQREARLTGLKHACEAAVVAKQERLAAAALSETLRARARTGYEAGELTLVEWLSADAAALEDQMSALEAEHHASSVSLELSRWTGDNT
ncbi:MAG: TolC family protein [bacterium]